MYRIVMQMRNGCARHICVNKLCKNNPNFEERSEQEALTEALKIFKKYSEGEIANLNELVCDTSSQLQTWKTI